MSKKYLLVLQSAYQTDPDYPELELCYSPVQGRPEDFTAQQWDTLEAVTALRDTLVRQYPASTYTIVRATE